MTRTNVLVLLIFTAVAIAAAALMRSSQEPAGEQPEGAYFPGLLEQSNEVVKAVIKNRENTTTIIKEGEIWNIVEKDRYPAALDKVRELVLGMARLKRIEGKTSKPELYGKLGLEGMDEPGSSSSLFQLLDDSGGTLAILIIGNEKVTQSGTPRRRLYVRTPGDPQAWLVEGQIPQTGDAIAWMDTSIFGEEAPAIRSVRVSRNGESWVVSRENAETEVFELEGLAAGEEIDSQYAVNQVARSLERLVFEDVRTAPEGTNENQADRVVVETFDDVHITLSLREEGDQYLGRLSAEYKPSGDGDDGIRSKVGAWNDRWRGWDYIFPDYQVENFTIARDDLIKQETDEAASQ